MYNISMSIEMYIENTLFYGDTSSDKDSVLVLLRLLSVCSTYRGAGLGQVHRVSAALLFTRLPVVVPPVGRVGVVRQQSAHAGALGEGPGAVCSLVVVTVVTRGGRVVVVVVGVGRRYSGGILVKVVGGEAGEELVVLPQTGAEFLQTAENRV